MGKLDLPAHCGECTHCQFSWIEDNSVSSSSTKLLSCADRESITIKETAEKTAVDCMVFKRGMVRGNNLGEFPFVGN